MFRYVLSLVLLSAVTVFATPASPATASTTTTTTTTTTDVPANAELDIMLHGTSRQLPTVSEPNDKHACYCIQQGEDCSPILAASSGTCTAHTLRRRQTEPCILRCASYCLHRAESFELCRSLSEWLNQKVQKIFISKHFSEGSPAQGAATVDI